MEFITDTSNSFDKTIGNVLHDTYGNHGIEMFNNLTEYFLKDLKVHDTILQNTNFPENVTMKIMKYYSKDIKNDKYFKHPFNLECIKRNNYNIPSFCFVGLRKYKDIDKSDIEYLNYMKHKYDSTIVVNNEKYILMYIHKYDNYECRVHDYNDILNRQHPYYQFYQNLLVYFDLCIDKMYGKVAFSSTHLYFNKNGEKLNNFITYTFKRGMGSLKNIRRMTLL